MTDVDWSKTRADLAICDCGAEYVARIDIPSFDHFVTDRPCPTCNRTDAVHEVVFNEPIPRILHFFSKLFGRRKAGR